MSGESNSLISTADDRLFEKIFTTIFFCFSTFTRGLLTSGRHKVPKFSILIKLSNSIKISWDHIGQHTKLSRDYTIRNHYGGNCYLFGINPKNIHWLSERERERAMNCFFTTHKQYSNVNLYSDLFELTTNTLIYKYMLQCVCVQR